jgi:hypothetical protein
MNLKDKFILLYAIIIIISASVSEANELTQEVLTEGLRKNSKVFEVLPITTQNIPLSFEITLGKSSAKINDGDEFDGFRFSLPDGVKNADLVWYFNAPTNWGNWYIMPLSGEVTGGFTEWLNGDKVYKNIDIAGEENRIRILQTLNSDYFKEGKEYIIWFRKVDKAKENGKLRGVISFVTKKDEWDYENIENALKLKQQKALFQVEELKSRGGKILLDKTMFDSDYAAERVDSLFFNLRNTKTLTGGFFITIETVIPACRSNVTITDIIKKYGPPDFIRTSTEKQKVLEHAGATPEKENSATRYYYDYFAFEVQNNDPSKKVDRVLTNADNFADVTPKDEKSYYKSVPMKNLTLFHKNKKEVGRLYFFKEIGKEPLLIKVPPVGLYKNGHSTLEYKGDGEWIWKTFFTEGKLARVISFKNHKMDGIATGYYRNGKKSFQASYQKGVLNGDVIRYSEDGEQIDTH